jgi:hypothetical protein
MTECQHHWMIGAATGPTSLGVCQLCGETKMFANSIERPDWMGRHKKAALEVSSDA